MNSLVYHEQVRESHEMLDFIEDTIAQELLSIPKQVNNFIHFLAFF